MFNSLFAVCLLVEDVKRSTAFYKDVLGLEINSADGGFANFKLQGTELAIFEKKDATGMLPASYIKPSGGFLLGFRVKDLEQACATLKERGASFFEGPKQTAWGQKVAYFYDPDKNIWEVSEFEKEQQDN
jgi:catechol 2,3-dioxygenase-like lactoylglutathione lyase family enzyme